MTDRALLFVVSLVAVLAAVGAAIWLIAAGQLGTFDGNFLLLCALIVVASFGLYLKYMIAKAMEAPPAGAQTHVQTQAQTQARLAPKAATGEKPAGENVETVGKA